VPRLIRAGCEVVAKLTRLDLVLLHAPSVYDFRERFAVYGPISDVIPSTPIFEMYPLGFVSMVAHLEKHGYRARIINVAVKMLRDPKFDVEEFVEGLDARAYGVDLHWLAHADGATRLAEAVKRHHPDAPVLMGGLSASYFHEEIAADYPQVDYVLRGDSTEEPLLELMRCLDSGKTPDNVPNLTWRDAGGKKRVNPLTHVPRSLDDVILDYEVVVKLVLRHRDLESNLPYESFMDYPFTAVLTCKGCSRSCVTCGGSRYSFSNFYGRDGPVFKSPGKLVEEMKVISDYFKTPIFLLGDLNQGGERYAEGVLDEIKREKVDNTVIFELFEPATEDFLKRAASSCESFSMEISPDSHDEGVRRLQGKSYTNEAMDKSIGKAMGLGSLKYDVFFMSGLPGQTRDSVLASAEYGARLMGEYKERNVYAFLAPMAPFLDPGSIAFEEPEAHGYTRLLGTLGEHRAALSQPTWKHVLNYSTRWMSRDDVCASTYDGMQRLNRAKVDLGVIDPGRGDTIEEGLTRTMALIGRVDEILASTPDEEKRTELLKGLDAKDGSIGKTMIYLKRELRVPGGAGVRVSGVVKHLLRRSRR